MKSARWCLSLLLLGALQRVAAAQDSERVRDSVRLYDEASAALARGETAIACAKFDRSQRLDPQLGTQLHLADCYEKLGKLASAWLNFRAAELLAAERNAAGTVEPRESVARRRAALLRPRVPELRIIVPTPATLTRVELDGHELPPEVWGVSRPLDPGVHVVHVSANARKAWTQTLEVELGSHHELLVPALELEASAVLAPLKAPPAQSAWPWQRIAAVAVAGLGVATGAAGIGFGIATTRKVAQRDRLCPMDTCANAGEIDQVQQLTRASKQLATAANVLMIGGGVLAASGATWFLYGGAGTNAPRVDVALSVLPHTAAVMVQSSLP